MLGEKDYLKPLAMIYCYMALICRAQEYNGQRLNTGCFLLSELLSVKIANWVSATSAMVLGIYTFRVCPFWGEKSVLLSLVILGIGSCGELYGTLEIRVKFSNIHCKKKSYSY